ADGDAEGARPEHDVRDPRGRPERADDSDPSRAKRAHLRAPPGSGSRGDPGPPRAGNPLLTLALPSPLRVVLRLVADEAPCLIDVPEPPCVGRHAVEDREGDL